MPPHILLKALERSRGRFQIAKRYQKMQHVFHKVNRSRRILRDKVDLLCQDLVHSNVELINSLRLLRSAYDFQSDLTGEFDLRYLLHKALRQIKEQIDDSNALIYLCHSKEIEAHISGPWYDSQHDLAEIAEFLKQTAVAKTASSRNPLLVPNAAQWQDILPPQRNMLAGLSLMALPVVLDDEILGVLVIYRDCARPLGPADSTAVQPLISPLARAIAAIQKLQDMIIQ